MKYNYHFYKDTGYNFIEYDLLLRSNITVIEGNSGTGKTLLTEIVREEASKGNREYAVIDAGVSNLNIMALLQAMENKLIVIDDCDAILSKSVLNYIIHDEKNKYILFGRTLGKLHISPNVLGEFVLQKTENGYKIKIEYEFSIAGWYN